jgi:dUTPase
VGPLGPAIPKSSLGSIGFVPQQISFHSSIAQLWQATKTSPGLDLCATSSTVLTPEEGIQAIPTGIRSPLPPNTFGIVLGRASLSLK